MDSCAIPYCEFKDVNEHDDVDSKLMPICKSHAVHLGCFKMLLKKEKLPKCPICRDDYISHIKDLIDENPHEKRMEPWEELDFPDMFTMVEIVEIVPCLYCPTISTHSNLTPKPHVNQRQGDRLPPRHS